MKKEWRKKLALTLAVAMGISLLSGCGGRETQGGGNTGSDIGTVQEATNAAEQTESEAPEKSEARDGSTVYVQVHQDSGTFNPWGSNQDPFMSIRLNFYETLFEYNASGEVVPLLVESYEWEDGTTLNLKLHDGIMTHDGNKIVASDVLFSFQKASESAEYGRHASNVDFEKSHVVDDLNLVLATKAEDTFFYNDMTRISIVSEKSFNDCKDEMVNLAIGSGPYKMTDYTPGYEWVLEKFEDYWNTDQTETQKQNVDKIVYRVITEEAQRTIELETGGIDMLTYTPSIDVEYLQGKDGIEVYQYPGNNTQTIYYNCSGESVMDNENLRHAISCAVDSAGIAAAVHKNLYSPADCIATPNTPQYQAGTLKYSYDMEKAKEYMVAAGYPDGGLDLTIMCDANTQPSAEVIQASVLQLGINLEILVYDAATYNTLITDPAACDMLISGYACVGTVLFFFNNQLNENKSLRTFWKNEEFQTLLAETVKTGDAEDTMKLLDMVNDADVVRPIVFGNSYFAYRTEVIEGISPKNDNWVLPGDYTYHYDADALYD